MSQSGRQRSEPPSSLEAAGEVPEFRELLAAPARARQTPEAPAGAAAAVPVTPWLGECVQDRHPVFTERVLVRRLDAAQVPPPAGEVPSGDQGVWLPVLRGLAVRQGDRVLIMPLPGAESTVIGVLDGLRRREPPAPDGGPRIELRPGEALTVTLADGAKLLEIVPSENGPVVRLLHSDTRVELPGKLELRAGEIELVAERGSVRLEAADDVVLIGETVRLN